MIPFNKIEMEYTLCYRDRGRCNLNWTCHYTFESVTEADNALRKVKLDTVSVIIPFFKWTPISIRKLLLIHRYLPQNVIL